MAHSQTAGSLTIGYLSVLQIPEHGWVGGYLVVNEHGRPVEFHCTVPLQPNRAQQILYGPTLAAYVHGEQIGRALLGRARADTALVLTDQGSTLWARPYSPCPLLWIQQHATSPDGSIPDAEASQSEPAHIPAAPCDPQPDWMADSYQLAIHRDYPDDQPSASATLAGIAHAWDLGEPFERIHGAILEAQRAA